MTTKKQNGKASSHWFVSSVANWEAGTDLTKVLANQRRRDKTCKMYKQPLDVHIYRVPLASDAPYSINNYAPEVEGTEFIGHADLTKEGDA